MTEQQLIEEPATNVVPMMPRNLAEQSAPSGPPAEGWLVRVSQEASERWLHRSWPDVFAGAMTGQDGLMLVASVNKDRGFAFLREGWRPDVTCLHAQNW